MQSDQTKGQGGQPGCGTNRACWLPGHPQPFCGACPAGTASFSHEAASSATWQSDTEGLPPTPIYSLQEGWAPIEIHLIFYFGGGSALAPSLTNGIILGNLLSFAESQFLHL